MKRKFLSVVLVASFIANPLTSYIPRCNAKEVEESIDVQEYLESLANFLCTALIRNRVPFEYNKKNIKQLILNTVTKKESLNGKVNSSGIINMKHAIEELENAKIGKNDTGSL